jgi:hypothetical protein
MHRKLDRVQMKEGKNRRANSREGQEGEIRTAEGILEKDKREK